METMRVDRAKMKVRAEALMPEAPFLLPEGLRAPAQFCKIHQFLDFSTTYMLMGNSIFGYLNFN